MIEPKTNMYVAYVAMCVYCVLRFSELDVFLKIHQIPCSLVSNVIWFSKCLATNKGIIKKEAMPVVVTTRKTTII